MNGEKIFLGFYSKRIMRIGEKMEQYWGWKKKRSFSIMVWKVREYYLVEKMEIMVEKGNENWLER